ncbi:hypothetical protein LVY72_06330 [Arthrobacter sp. I2-34]|uniref:Permease n=1 Tax=Arthrobacter hankyongi TaxID=2904801 RepID=A0ABS9L4I5_9MICC|nr:hypothetical protein [Arthrobacter hankyongi]MCG2621531.1 hypothetical protein [Arthrobacter hankyongi]
MRNWIVAAAAAAALCAVTGASYVSPEAVVVIVCAASVAAGVGWPILLGVPARKTLAAVIALAGIAAAVLAWTAPQTMAMQWTVVVVALAVMAVFVIQLLRGTGQPHRLESTFGASTGAVLAALGAGWVASDRLALNAANSSLMLVVAISMLFAIGACVLPWPDRFVAPLGVALAALAGGVGGVLLASVPVWPAVVVGAVMGAVVVCFRRLLLGAGSPAPVPALLSAGLMPVLATGSLVYSLERLLIH